MYEDLGFEKLLDADGFFAYLLGRSPSGEDRKPLYGSDLPVVLLTGGPGMGKGRLLRAVHARFARQVPVIRLDCASSEYADRAGPEPGARSAVTEALFEAALLLHTWRGTGGAFIFPRFFAGLAVIATGVADGTRAGITTEVERYEELMQQPRLRALSARDVWRGALLGAVRNMLEVLAAQALGQDGAAALTALLDALFERLTPRGEAELTRIYGEYPGAAGQPKHGLRKLAVDFRAGGEGREDAERFLFRALREDLEAAYGGLGGWLGRVGRPGLLLDHAEEPLGERLLRAVLADRRDGQRDRVVIVGTARRADGGDFLHGGLPPREVAAFRPADGVPATWSRRRDAEGDRGPLSAGVLILRMPYLTGDQLRRATERIQLGAEREGGADRRRITAAVAQLSGGRPHTVVRLATAAADHRMETDDNDRAILDAKLHHPDGAPERPVTDVLLEELILDQLPVRLAHEHHDQWLDLLTHLSVAHDLACADVLLHHHQAGRVLRLSAHEVAQLLNDTGWPSCERHFIGDFGLRQLLVHRLYGLEHDGAAWYADHHLLRDHYAVSEPSGGAFRSVTTHQMNHHLVSGGVDDVVRHLAATLPGRPRQWCEELLEIAQAPYPGGADERRKRAQGLVPVEGAPLRRTVDQLLHAVWLCEERTRPTGGEMAGTLEQLLRLLSTMDFDGAGELGPTATQWSRLAANEQPLLRCACTDQLGRRR
ncbi:hypothetical protein [Streptomyces canus]|uniref:hypothetical protein n=1 Tax=Streptomyces canus TaxID=58343 RepID=UPI00035C10A2|nr:hypothetical protein [Streptomyces canus]